MIHVDPAPEPADFDTNVRSPGHRALAEMVGEDPPTRRTGGRPFKKIADRREEIPSERLPTYWQKALEDLMRAYDAICAYSCFRIHPVTGSKSVDHMVPKSRSWDERFLRVAREADADRYWSADCSLETLERESPFVAKELRRQGRLRGSDEQAEEGS